MILMEHNMYLAVAMYIATLLFYRTGSGPGYCVSTSTADGKTVSGM